LPENNAAAGKRASPSVPQPLRVGWFSTGRGEGSRNLLQAALRAIRDGHLPAEIAFIFSNREHGEFEATDRFFVDVAASGIPLITLSDRRFRRASAGEVARKGAPLPAWRVEYDRAVVAALEPYGCDIAMLAGYMLISTAPLFSWRPLLNLHPAAPGGPAGTWQDVIWQLIDRQAERSGVRIHLSTAELDEGPIVTYCTYPLRGPGIDDLWSTTGARSIQDLRNGEGEALPLFQEIRRRGAAREAPLVIETLRAFASRRLRVVGDSLCEGSTPLARGFDLTPEIEATLASTVA